MSRIEEHKIAVYAILDEQGRLLDINSEMFLHDVRGWVRIDEGSGDRYTHAYNHYLPGRPSKEDGVPLYRWDGAKIVKRTEEEVAGDRAALSVAVPQPTELEQLRADMDYIAIMTGVEL